MVFTALLGTVLQLLHDTPQAGHPGWDRTLSAAHSKYYWPTVWFDIEKHVFQCLSHAQSKGITKADPILEYPLPSGPFDEVSLDLLQFPSIHLSFPYLSVWVDQFSCLVILAPLPNKSDEVAAHALVSYLIYSYTIARVLWTDNENEYDNFPIHSVC